MEKLAEVKKSLFTQLIDDSTHANKQISIYPQMPAAQIQYYIKRAARKKRFITIQFNPTSFSKEYTEASGQIQLSHKSSHIILTTKNSDKIHLIHPQYIRHIRLVH